MCYFEKFHHGKSLATYQNNYTEIHRYDRSVKLWRLQIQSGRQRRVVQVRVED